MSRNIKIFIVTLCIVFVGGMGLALLYVANNNERAALRESAEVAAAVDEDIRAASVDMAVSQNETDATVSANEPSVSSDEAIYADEPYTKVIEPSTEGELTISFAGDVLFDPGYAIFSSYKARGCDINQCISADLLEKMRSADIMMVNNEFPYSDRGAPLADKMYTFRAQPESVALLDDMGVDIVALANNHTFDYGEEAFLDTLDVLSNANMPYVGAGHNIEEATQPYYFVAGGKKIAILSATQIERYANPHTRGATEDSCGVFRCMDPQLLIDTITEVKKECDFVIVYIHWGTESTDELDWAQEPQAQQYADAGADLIIGDHPHVLQEIGYKGDTPVIYSLGNYWFNSKTMDSCIVTLTLNLEDASIKSLRFEPCLQSNMSVALLHDSEKARVINYMRSISDSANIDDDGYVTAK